MPWQVALNAITPSVEPCGCVGFEQNKDTSPIISVEKVCICGHTLDQHDGVADCYAETAEGEMCVCSAFELQKDAT